MSNRTGFLFFAALLFSNLVEVESAFAQSISKPSVPEFTLKYVDTSYDVPSTYSIDSYTGNVTIKAGYHVNKCLELTIRNQPIYPMLFYNVRYKGHFEDNWTEIFSYQHSFPESQNELFPGSLPHRSDSEYTIITIPRQISVTENEIDFQVQAMEWHTESYGNGKPGLRWTSFESSEWSSTQTITYDKAAFTTSPHTLPPYTLPSQNSTATPSQLTEPALSQPADSAFPEPVETGKSAAVISAVVAIVGAVAALLVYFDKHRVKT